MGRVLLGLKLGVLELLHFPVSFVSRVLLVLVLVVLKLMQFSVFFMNRVLLGLVIEVCELFHFPVFFPEQSTTWVGVRGLGIVALSSIFHEQSIA